MKGLLGAKKEAETKAMKTAKQRAGMHAGYTKNPIRYSVSCQKPSSYIVFCVLSLLVLSDKTTQLYLSCPTRQHNTTQDRARDTTRRDETKRDETTNLIIDETNHRRDMHAGYTKNPTVVCVLSKTLIIHSGRDQTKRDKTRQRGDGQWVLSTTTDKPRFD
jgi:hypothetical protein